MAECKIQEGMSFIKIPSADKISKEMQVFYNPVMKLNRDIAVLIVKALINEAAESKGKTDNGKEGKEKIRIADPLAATGIRAIRFLKETEGSKIECICLNDISKDAVKLIHKNLKLNTLKASKNGKIRVHAKEANKFLYESQGFEYIDIDPFGSPNKFLESAVHRIKDKGILAITATDTAALSGTYPAACTRKYWAKPLLNYMMHETGIRILIRKAQLIGAQYAKALTPVFVHSSDHYMRIYFRAKKGKEKTNQVIEQHKYILFCKECGHITASEHTLEECEVCEAGKSKAEYAGPLWTRQLWDTAIIEKMIKKATNHQQEGRKLLNIIKEEAKIPTLGFYDVHEACSKLKTSSPPFKKILEELRKKGHEASQTHFSRTGIRTTANAKKFNEILKTLAK